MSHRILITGGAGFIGSHTFLVSLNQGHRLVVLDDFDNSNPEALHHVQDLASSDALQLIKGDVRDHDALDRAFCSSGEVNGVIHFASLKAVGESVADPLRYFNMTLDHLLQQPSPTELTLNIGTGTGLSVLDVVHGFERTTGLVIPYDVVERRPGDVARLQACPRKAQEVLGWTARRGLEEMCRDGWAWQQANPMGYKATR